MRYPRGKTLGGCSSINGMIYMRGQKRDYDRWADLTNDPEWNWDNALKDFKAHENHYRLDKGADPASGSDGKFSDLHGSGGEWRFEKQRLRWEITEAFSEAAENTGIVQTDDFNTGDNAGVGYFEVNQKAGWRWSTTKAFLRPVRHRDNLTVWTEAHTERLLFETGDNGQPSCNGVVVRRREDSVSVLAS